jgi:hypothetical protein
MARAGRGAVRPLRAAGQQGGGVARGRVGGGEPRPVDRPPPAALRPQGAHLPALELLQQHALRHPPPPRRPRRRRLWPDRQGVGLVRTYVRTVQRPIIGATDRLWPDQTPVCLSVVVRVVDTVQEQLFDTAHNDGSHGALRVPVSAPPPALGRPGPRRRGARARRGHRAPVLCVAQGVPLVGPPLRLLPLAAPLRQGAPALHRHVLYGIPSRVNINLLLSR